MRRRVLPRLSQLLLAEPHLTNRYLNILLFARHRQPAAWGTFRSSLDAETVQQLDELAGRSPHRRPARSPGRRLATASAFAAVALLFLISGAVIRPQDEADSAARSQDTASSIGSSIESSGGPLLEGSSKPFVTIPDNDSAGVSDAIHIAAADTVGAIEVDVMITHDFVGDLELTLVSPSGNSAVLQEYGDDSASDLQATYDISSAPTLGIFEDEIADGDWILRVTDNSAGVDGTLESWALRIAPS